MRLDEAKLYRVCTSCGFRAGVAVVRFSPLLTNFRVTPFGVYCHRCEQYGLKQGSIKSSFYFWDHSSPGAPGTTTDEEVAYMEWLLGL